MADSRRRAPDPEALTSPLPPLPEVDPLESALARANDAMERALDGYSCDGGVSIYGDYVYGQLAWVIRMCHKAQLEILRKRQALISAHLAESDEEEIDTPLYPTAGNPPVHEEGGEA